MKTNKDRQDNRYNCKDNERRLYVYMCVRMYDVCLCVRGKGSEWECNLDVHAGYAVYSDVFNGT